MERSVEIFAAINFLAMGTSHIVQPAAWKQFFTVLHEKGVAGNFFNAMLALGMGSLIVAFHPTWDGVVPSLLNVYGWLSVIKGSAFLLFPTLGLRSIEKPVHKDPRLFAIPGVMLLALGAALVLYPFV